MTLRMYISTSLSSLSIFFYISPLVQIIANYLTSGLSRHLMMQSCEKFLFTAFLSNPHATLPFNSFYVEKTFTSSQLPKGGGGMTSTDCKHDFLCSPIFPSIYLIYLPLYYQCQPAYHDDGTADIYFLKQSRTRLIIIVKISLWHKLSQ
jgi:hypothetical protein